MKKSRAYLYSMLAVLSWPRAAAAAEGDAQFAVSPESAFNLLDAAIRDAKESIELNIYMLTSKSIAQALADKAESGLRVTVLLEGETFGGEILQPVKRILDDLSLSFEQRSQGRGKFLVMTGRGGSVPRRYVFDHAKYLIVDQKKVFVSSENITGSAFNPKNLTGGTRGWEVVLENAGVAAGLEKMFVADSDLTQADVVPYQKASFRVKDPGSSPLPPRSPRNVPAFPVTAGKVAGASLCASPGSTECFLSFIRAATHELSIEHMSLPQYWVSRSGGAKKENPIVQEILAAARRGVKVRVLLNDDQAFGDDGGDTSPDEKNSTTVSFLGAEASRAHLPLEAALFDQKAVQVNYVHNKGMVADGQRVFVGSINGTENSVQSNREVALALVSRDAAKFYGDAFELDWSLRAR